MQFWPRSQNHVAGSMAAVIVERGDDRLRAAAFKTDGHKPTAAVEVGHTRRPPPPASDHSAGSRNHNLLQTEVETHT